MALLRVPADVTAASMTDGVVVLGGVAGPGPISFATGNGSNNGGAVDIRVNGNVTSAGGYTVSGAGVTLGGPGVTQRAAGAVTISATGALLGNPGLTRLAISWPCLARVESR